MRAGRHVVRDGQRLDVSDAPQRDRALAVLRRFRGVGRGSAREGRGIGEKIALISASVFGSSNLPATKSTALSGW